MAQNDSQPPSPPEPPFASPSTEPTSSIQVTAGRPRHHASPAPKAEPYNHLPAIFFPLQQRLDSARGPRPMPEKPGSAAAAEPDPDPDRAPLSARLRTIRLLSHITTYLLSLALATLTTVLLLAFPAPQPSPHAPAAPRPTLLLRDPETWPLYLLLYASAMSVALSITGVLGTRYFFEGKKRPLGVVLAGYGACAAGWLVVVLLLRGGRAFPESWRRSCSATGGGVAEGSDDSVISPSKLCSLQIHLSILPLLELATNALSALAYYAAAIPARRPLRATAPPHPSSMPFRASPSRTQYPAAQTIWSRDLPASWRRTTTPMSQV